MLEDLHTLSRDELLTLAEDFFPTPDDQFEGHTNSEVILAVHDAYWDIRDLYGCMAEDFFGCAVAKRIGHALFDFEHDDTTRAELENIALVVIETDIAALERFEGLVKSDMS